jgi:3-methyladenine DNA glycosylase AlkD
LTPFDRFSDAQRQAWARQGGEAAKARLAYKTRLRALAKRLRRHAQAFDTTDPALAMDLLDAAAVITKGHSHA